MVKGNGKHKGGTQRTVRANSLMSAVSIDQRVTTLQAEQVQNREQNSGSRADLRQKLEQILKWLHDSFLLSKLTTTFIFTCCV
jgi:hypothetical protein